MKVLTVIGNRPQFVKAAPVSKVLREVAEEVLVHTGQHYDREMSEIFFEDLEIPPPDYHFESGAGSHAAQTGSMMTQLEPLLEAIAPEAVLLYGDTNSTLAGALVAAKAHVPIVHVEAGMRSFNREMPEEINRVVADSLSGLLLCPTETAVENLRTEGMGEGARLVGDVMADVAELFGPIADRRSQIVAKLGLQERGFSVCTAHRAGNVDDPVNLYKLVAVLARVAEETGLPVVFAVHPRTRRRLEAEGMYGDLGAQGIAAVTPLGYLDMTRLVRASRAVITDSGGLQKEAFLASVPCLTMREETEWVETVETGWNRLVGLDAEAAARALAELPEPGAGEASPALEIYGGGNAAERVRDELRDWLA